MTPDRDQNRNGHAEDLRTRRENMDLDQYDDSQSDSGVSADFSPTAMSDNETPIEREIRLTFKREQSLRRSRGLDETKEFIEIPVRKSILSQDLPEKSAKDHGKERQFAGKKMQREIRAEAEREKVLVKLGRLPGFYDRGSVRQLQEKKLLFESFLESKDLHISGDGAQDQPRLEVLFRNHSPCQTNGSSTKVLQSSNNHETFCTVQKVKSDETPCNVLHSGNPGRSSKEHLNNLEVDSSPQLFSSLKEKKLLFESFQDYKDIHISKYQDRGVSESFKERRTSPNPLYQRQNSTQEPKDLQIKRNQQGFTKQSQRNPNVHKPKPCGPGLSEAVDRQVIIIENDPAAICHAQQAYRPSCIRPSKVQNRTVNGDEVKENPFFKLRSSLSLLPDVQKDIREAKSREEELRKQRTSLYGDGSKVTESLGRTTSTHANIPVQHLNISPGSLSFRKLDVTWPPAALQNAHKTQPQGKVTASDHSVTPVLGVGSYHLTHR